MYAQVGTKIASPGAESKSAILVNDLLTRKIGKIALRGDLKLVLESIATPVSRSTIVLRISIEQKIGRLPPSKIEAKMLTIAQASKRIAIENIFLESKKASAGFVSTNGLLLIRAQEIKRGNVLTLELQPAQANQGKPLTLKFSSDFGRR